MGIQKKQDGAEQSIRSRKAARNREEILSVAQKLIVEKGYDGFSMNELARSALFTKRTVYAYFQSKQELFLALVHEVFVTLNEFLEKHLAETKSLSGMAQLEELGTVLVGFYREHPEYFKIIADYENQESDFTDPGEIAAACYREGELVMFTLKNILSLGMKDGSIRKTIDIDDTAVLLWSFFSGILITLVKKKEYLARTFNLKPEELITKAYLFIKTALQPERN